MPGDTKNAWETTNIERVQLLLLPCMKGPGLTAVQECPQDTGSIDLDLGICRQLLIKPCSLIAASVSSFLSPEKSSDSICSRTRLFVFLEVQSICKSLLQA